MSSTSGASGTGRVGVRRSVRRRAAPNPAQNTVQAFEALIKFLLASSRSGLSQLGSGAWAVSSALSKLIFVLLPFHVDRIERSYVGFFDRLYIPICFFSFHPLILSHDPYYIAHF